MRCRRVRRPAGRLSVMRLLDRNSALNHQVLRPPGQDEVLDIVAPHDHQLPLWVNLQRIDNRHPFIASTRDGARNVGDHFQEPDTEHDQHDDNAKGEDRGQAGAAKVTKQAG
jgi:hypothetical protein